jgi:hypothetical protein
MVVKMILKNLANYDQIIQAQNAGITTLHRTDFFSCLNIAGAFKGQRV